jgi:hypothetical protein
VRFRMRPCIAAATAAVPAGALEPGHGT